MVEVLLGSSRDRQAEPVRGKSPGNPYLGAGETANVASSRGFEAMGGSPDGRYLYPVVEGALNDDSDRRRRWIYQYDLRAAAYGLTGGRARGAP